MRLFNNPDELYHSKEWEKFVAALKLERVNEDGEVICAHCGRPIVRRYDCIGHHKTELTEENVNDPEIAFSPDNVELIHFKCHNEIHARFGGLKQQVYIVHGSPCAGKTTFVKEHANADDLIVDVDALYKAVSLCFTHDQPARLKANVLGLRDVLFDQIRIRKGLWRNAWIITSKTSLELAQDAAVLRAQLVHIDTDRQTCLDNLHRDPNGRDIARWTGYIDDYFDRLAIE